MFHPGFDERGRRVKFLWIFVSWAVVAFGQPAWISWLAPFAACIGYALFWRIAAEIPFSKKRFWLATSWFAAVQLIQLSWMTSTEFQGFYILGVYAVLAVWLGVQFGLVTLFIDKIPLVATAALWTLMEWGRLFVLCGFSWNPVGLSLTAFPVSLQAASLFGILGLSFLVFLTNLAFWKNKKAVAVSLMVFPYLFGVMHTWYHSSKVAQSETMIVGLVQTGLLPSEKIIVQDREHEFISPYEQWRRIVELVKKCDQPLDLIVLPEFTVPVASTYNFYSSSIVRHILEDILDKGSLARLPNIEKTVKVSNEFWVQTLGKIFNTDVIAGLETEENGLHYTSAVFSPKNGNASENYHKQVLVPLAEYVPFEWVKKLTAGYGITEFFTHGKESKVFASKVPLSASICYEETFSHLMRQNRQNGASLFVNLTNDGWYANSRLPQQHFDHARIRAVENGVPLVRACNTGVTAAVDSLGRIIGQIVDEKRADVLVAQVPLYHYLTLYSVWGDWGIVLLSISLILICLYINKSKIKLIQQ
jgi:apolipoprotein N-acyltransferase